MQMDLDIPGFKGIYDIGTYSLDNGRYRFVSTDSEIARQAGFGVGEVSTGDYIINDDTLKLYDEDGTVITLKRDD